MEYAGLILLHVLASVLWAGGAISMGFFVVPAVLDAGPPGAAVMGGVMNRKFPVVMTVLGLVTVLTGSRLYALRFSAAWLGTPEGIALSLGGLLGIGALAIGLLVQKPAAMRIGALGAEIAAAGAPPTVAQAAEMQALRTRLGKAARLTAWHLLAATALMASHRLAATM